MRTEDDGFIPDKLPPPENHIRTQPPAEKACQPSKLEYWLCFNTPIQILVWLVGAAFFAVVASIWTLLILGIGDVPMLGAVLGGFMAWVVLWSKHSPQKGSHLEFLRSALAIGMVVGGLYAARKEYWEMSPVAKDSKEYAELRYMWQLGLRQEVISRLQSETGLPSGRQYEPPKPKKL